MKINLSPDEQFPLRGGHLFECHLIFQTTKFQLRIPHLTLLREGHLCMARGMGAGGIHTPLSLLRRIAPKCTYAIFRTFQSKKKFSKHSELSEYISFSTQPNIISQ